MSKATNYPFGDQLFIGIVKFFDWVNGFGYIASNRYRLESVGFDRDRNSNSFKMNQSSWSQIAPDKAVVVFRPAIINGVTWARSVRKVNPENEEDYKLLLEYYNNLNFIDFPEQRRIYHRNRNWNYSSPENRHYSILLVSKLPRHRLLQGYKSDFLQSKNFHELLSNIDRLIEACCGEEYYNRLIRVDGTNEDELKVWGDIFSALTANETEILIDKHPSLQILAPRYVLLNRLDTIEERWGIPETINEEFEFIRSLRSLRERINDIDPNNITNFIENTKSIIPIYSGISATRQDSFVQQFEHEYEEKLTELIKAHENLPWDNHDKIRIKNFLTDDSVSSLPGISSAKSNFVQIIAKDYQQIATEDTNLQNPYRQFDAEYSCLFSDNIYREMTHDLEMEAASNNNILNPIRLFLYECEKYPEDMADSMFGKLVIDRIVNESSSGQGFFFRHIRERNFGETRLRESSSELTSLANELNVRNHEYTITQFQQLCLTDKIGLFLNCGQPVINTSDVIEYLSQFSQETYDVSGILYTSIGRDALLEMLYNFNYLSKEGISNAIYWIKMYDVAGLFREGRDDRHIDLVAEISQSENRYCRI